MLLFFHFSETFDLANPLAFTFFKGLCITNIKYLTNCPIKESVRHGARDVLGPEHVDSNIQRRHFVRDLADFRQLKKIFDK